MARALFSARDKAVFAVSLLLASIIPMAILYLAFGITDIRIGLIFAMLIFPVIWAVMYMKVIGPGKARGQGR